jgi:hypothetical protein
MIANQEPDFNQLKKWCGNHSHHWGTCRVVGRCTKEQCPIWAFVRSQKVEEVDE